MRVASAEGTTDSEGTDAPPPVLRKKGVSEEWKTLPRQPWESINIVLPPEVDAQGFDRRNRLNVRKRVGFDLDFLPSVEEIEGLGKVASSISEENFLGLDRNHVMVQGQGLTVGASYQVIGEPERIKSSETGRKAYIYPILGTVKITSTHEDLFIADVTHARDMLPRGSRLIQPLDRVLETTPVASPTVIEASVLISRFANSYATAQHKTAFIDKGSSDGVQKGFVFRRYVHHDGVTEDKILEGDVLHSSDGIVIHTTDQFSTLLIIDSANIVPDQVRVVSLTDVSEFFKTKRRRGKPRTEPSTPPPMPISDAPLDTPPPMPVEEPLPPSPVENPAPAVDELDGLDAPPDQLQPGEQQELKQLENWKGNPESGTPPAPSDSGEALPPPPTSEMETVPLEPNSEQFLPMEEVPTAPAGAEEPPFSP